MPKKRDPEFVGELVPDRRGRGSPTDSPKALAGELRRKAMLIDMAKAVLRNSSIKRATLDASQKYGLAAETLTELWKANRPEALSEAASELIALRKISADDAVARIDEVLSEAGSRAQRRARSRS